jgi:hypothetical protein
MTQPKKRKAGTDFTMAEFAALTKRLAELNLSSIYLDSLTLLINAKDNNEQVIVRQWHLANIRDIVAILATDSVGVK